jgi:predicted Zn finger-like uncharacterized protein
MNSVIVVCPHCGAKLAVSEQSIKAHVRCGRCKEKFPIVPTAPKPVEDVVASWLTGEDGSGDDAPPGEDPGMDMNISGEDLLSATPPPAAASDSPDEAPATAGARPDARIVKVDGQGTLIEFATNLLQQPDFRAAFPRQCIRCDARMHLRAHAVIFTPQLMDSMSLEAEHKAGELVLSNEEVQGLTNQQMLDRLPAVPNIPPPGNLPMPYWICDMCSGSGQVSGQIQVNRETGGGFCRLLIRNPRRALGFIDSAVGNGIEGYQLVKDRADQLAENPWDNLAEVVQHRIQQWFQPRPGEQFLSYTPDRDYARTEDGMAGVLVTNQRLLAHYSRRHREALVTEALELTHAFGAGKGHVAIKTANWTIPRMTIDRDGIARLRRGLSLGKFMAVWH